MGEIYRFQEPKVDERGAGKITLTKAQGDLVRELITDNYPFGMSSYAQKVGIHAPNIYAVLNGERQCTIEYLNRILSGIRMEAKCLISINIQAFDVGEPVEDAHCQLLEGEWWSDETPSEDEE